MFTFFFHRNVQVGEDNENSKCRWCRSGAGKEVTPGKADTPGFALIDGDYIEYDEYRGLKLLKLKRTERRMKQTSKIMLQSWRANVDVQVIIYGCHPLKIDVSDIFRVSSYVVSYQMKGSASYASEQKMITDLIKHTEMEYIGPDNYDTCKVAKMILNKLGTQRVISKAEAAIECTTMDLVQSTETFDKLSISAYQKLFAPNRKRPSDENLVQMYSKRKNQPHLSLAQYWEHIKTGKKKTKVGTLLMQASKSKDLYLHVTGMDGRPVYPPSKSYARCTLIVNKPWSNINKLDFEKDHAVCPINEFLIFIRSVICPIFVRGRYENAKDIYRKQYGAIECTTENEPEIDPLGKDISVETEELLIAMRSSKFKVHELVTKIDFGLDYAWDEESIDVSF